MTIQVPPSRPATTWADQCHLEKVDAEEHGGPTLKVENNLKGGLLMRIIQIWLMMETSKKYDDI